MRRRIVRLLVLAVMLGGGAYLWVAARSPEAHPHLAGLLAMLGLGGGAEAASFSGYVEADYVMVAPTVGGRLVRLDVARGDMVAEGAPLFALESDAETMARDEAAARLAQAEAQLADLATGKRQPEIDAIAAQRVQAVAALQESEAELARQAQLLAEGYAAEKTVEAARARRDADRARVAELDAELAAARMPGRDAQVNAATAAVEAARAALAQAQWTLGQKQGFAPGAAQVVDTLFEPGEMVPAGQPVVRLLPPGNLKVRFFVPETRVATLAVGDAVDVACDGCAGPVRARVRFIAPEAEYTPPVIYSREERSRLVFMVEARAEAGAERLRVGQPVDVAPALP